jgi:hypothetical protein
MVPLIVRHSGGWGKEVARHPPRVAGVVDGNPPIRALLVCDVEALARHKRQVAARVLGLPAFPARASGIRAQI